MAKYVCAGAKMKCSMGSKESDLGVIPVRPCQVKIKGKLAATIMDHKPFVNIKPFGQCQSLANPTVAAATAANYGRLQKMPCIPNIVAPWIAGKTTVKICGEPMLLDNSKQTCMWAGMIEITNPGQDFVKEGAQSLNSNNSKVESEKKAKEVTVEAAEPEEKEEKEEEKKDVEKLTIKDFVEILEKIESKQEYEAARHYAVNHIDYGKINKLAKDFVDGKDDDPDNDPNIMPTRFMILYGADDSKLKKIDTHPDNFDGHEEHKMCVKNLRKAMKLLGLGRDIADDGKFDDNLYAAFMNYLRRFSRVNLESVLEYESEEDANAPPDSVANKYDLSSWKYFYDKKHSGDLENHKNIVERLSPKLGDELLKEKNVNPESYLPGMCYHYPWVPYSITIKFEEESDEKGKGEDV